MENDRKILGVCPWGHTISDGISIFDELLDDWVDITKCPLEKCSALLLWGGQDIDSGYYKQKKHYLNGAYVHNPRDIAEWHLMHKARELDIPIIGVCRGAQFLCAFAGGSLYQHVTGHGQNHLISTYNNGSFLASSSHHQMMDVSGVEHELLAWADKLSTKYEKESLISEKAPEKEPEVVWFPEVKGFAIQPHPEWMDDDCVFNTWLLGELTKFVTPLIQPLEC